VRGRLGVRLALTALLCCALTAGLPAGSPRAAAAGRRLPSYLSVDRHVHQLLTVTSPRWSSTRATLRAWQRRDGRWRLVHGPVRVRLGWNGWVRGQQRRQDSGTTPAGSYRLRYAFGNHRNPGTALRYVHVDGNDLWPYEPRDAATYNIYQPFQSDTSHWRRDFRERLSHYPRQYAYAVVIGFNLPSGVHWSRRRHQYVARRPADTTRGGGIFLHVQRPEFTAGCVAGRIDEIRWVVRWLAPAARPRIVMGPYRWVTRRF
jgi:L,D-peptidoglycan transpeptidase YkuD (ErfK/YbiS/YcfS/YnhG family)